MVNSDNIGKPVTKESETRHCDHISCFPTKLEILPTHVNMVLELIMTKKSMPHNYVAPPPQEIGADNCAMHHMCNKISLFQGQKLSWIILVSKVSEQFPLQLVLVT